ncbi:DUF5305 family protein [Cellulosilyticum sp. I15G10I2]|uniref:DUF5305 family protein n=1 Tax=Cellulosilyticum sp. I15G10I2 TaxID=1892843 RepID=UPI00085C84F5|nr:DUF5305 family protein [Cellulosilyticum sp. I15G10I2]
MKIKKVRINKVFRIGMIAAAGLLSIGAVFLIIKEYQAEHVREERETIYEYSMKSKVNYKVHVKPNILYEEEQLGEEQMYLTEFVDYISADFTSDFTGSDNIDIDGKYAIAAEVRGYTTKNDEKQIIWRKDFELVPEQRFKRSADKNSIKKEIQVNFPEYNQFAQSVLEASKVNLSVELVVKLLGSQTLDIPKGPLKDELQTSIIIPLNNGYFNITKEGETEKSDIVEEVTKIPVDINRRWIGICGGLVGAGILGIILMILFTAPLNAEDLRKKKIKKILNEHGSRMVIVDHIKITEDLEVYHVKTIDDLIKIADEIEKPVFYEQRDEIMEITKFYVKEQGILYIYEIEEEITLVLQEVFEEVKEEVKEDIIA